MAITSFTTAAATATDPRDDGGALFDAYVVVDWSAAAQPKTGRDSIWYTVYVPARAPPRGPQHTGPGRSP